jgi:hypothetical protein
MKLRYIYLFLCFPGAVLPGSQVIPWLMIHGLDLRLFFSELFSTRVGAFFGLDVIISALVLLVFIGFEGRRLGIEKLWAPVIATCAVGVSLGFPLFMYMRQLTLDKQSINSFEPTVR